MRFIDASVFLYAFLKPRRELPQHIAKLKENARKIISMIEQGEEVVTTIVHIAEVANILEARLPLDTTIEYISSILTSETIHVLDVALSDYVLALEKARRYRIGINDALAIVFMERLGISEIYSFDKHFDNVPGIRRVYEV